MFILQLRLLNFIKVRSDNHNKGGRHDPFTQQLTNELMQSIASTRLLGYDKRWEKTKAKVR